MANLDPEEILTRSLELQTTLSEVNCDSKASERQAIIQEYLVEIENGASSVIPEFDQGLHWINTSRPLSIREDFTNKIVILDFFTYCCINCMHILPDLECLENEYSTEDGVFVVGVHSAKFDNEKNSTNILSAVLRYDIHHPVVNDNNASLWQQLQIQCWPTLVILGPRNEILLTLMGEGNRKLLLEFVGIALDFYREKDLIKPTELPIELAKERLPKSVLSFPGKVAVDEHGQHLAISDTGHHRVLVVDKQGVVQHVVGGDEAGFLDGTFTRAKFHSPQGLAWRGEVIYVADTDNHAIRKIDLAQKKVTTIAGTGEQGHYKEGGAIGTKQPISSPWDVVTWKSVGSDSVDMLFIAMAGTHQIWMLFLEDAKWLKNTSYTKGTCISFAGSGNEENRNNSYPHRAGFAQPSGITTALCNDVGYLFVADSESSSVRMISLRDGSVKALVGGDRDPTNLFAYGDEDGKGYDVRLQHPLGVAMVGNAQDTLLVADSYNHKVKMISIKARECFTLIGNGMQGDTCGSFREATLNEPGGLACSPDGNTVFIADTNSHKVKVVNLQQKTISELPILIPEPDEVDAEVPTWKRLTPKRAPVIDCDPVSAAYGGELELHLHLSLSEGSKLTMDAPSSWQLWMEDDSLRQFLPENARTSGTVSNLMEPIQVSFIIPEISKYTSLTIRVECMIYHCSDVGLCKVAPLVFKQPVDLTPADDNNNKTVCDIKYTVN